MLRTGHLSSLYNLVDWRSLRIKLVGQGIIIGAISGGVVVFYRYLLEIANHNNTLVFNAIRGNPLLAIGVLVLMALAGLFVGCLIKKEPLISGSGIPQVEGHLLRRLDMNWWRIVVGKMVGGVIALGSGLSLGREGPSVQIGAAIGVGFSRIFHRTMIEERYLVTAGASAGLAAAFNAPLAGVVFALEEVHRHFSPLVLLSAASAALTADFISKGFFGLSPVFLFHSITPLPLNNYVLVLGLGVILGALGVLFNRGIIQGMDMFERQKWLPERYRLILPFVVTGLLALVLPQVLGGGHHLIETIVDTRLALGLVVLFLVVKLIFTIFCYGSGAPGGIFLPLLALGALAGNAYGLTLVQFLHLDVELVSTFTVLAMAGMFAAIVRAPITGTILITEMTGSFNHLLALFIVAITAHITADILRSEPIYESLLERLLSSRGNAKRDTEIKGNVLLEAPVCLGSAFDGTELRNVELPSSCLVVSVLRGGETLIPNGDTIVRSGDVLTLLTPQHLASEVGHLLQVQASQCILEAK